MLQSPNGIGRCDDDDKIAAMSTQVGPTGAENSCQFAGGRGRRYHLRPARPAARLHFRRALRIAKTPFASFIRATNKRPPTWRSATRRRAAASARALWCPEPGVLNATAALSTAYACNAPVLCITGQIPSAHIGGGLGFLHEIPDQTGLLASVSKWQGRVKSPAHAAARGARGFSRAEQRPPPSGGD